MHRGFAFLLLGICFICPAGAQAVARPQMPAGWDRVVDSCAAAAAAHYGYDSDILRALAIVEGGSPGMKSRNSNGTFDYGLMQVNSIWLRRDELRHVSETDLRHDRCKNVWVAAWIYALELHNAGKDAIAAAGNYHSKNPQLHSKYRSKFLATYRALLASRPKRAKADTVGLEMPAPAGGQSQGPLQISSAPSSGRAAVVGSTPVLLAATKLLGGALPNTPVLVAANH